MRFFDARFARRFGAQLLATCAALALVLTLTTGGRSFLWCPWMQRAITAECCHPVSKPKSDAPALERSSCCETKVVPMAPPGSAERSGLPEPSAQLWALSVDERPRFVGEVSDPLRPFVSARERGARAGPSAPLYDLNCAYLI